MNPALPDVNVMLCFTNSINMRFLCQEYVREKYQHCLQHRLFQTTIILLVVTMAFW